MGAEEEPIRGSRASSVECREPETRRTLRRQGFRRRQRLWRTRWRAGLPAPRLPPASTAAAKAMAVRKALWRDKSARQARLRQKHFGAVAGKNGRIICDGRNGQTESDQVRFA